MTDDRVVVVGGGVIGCAVAERLAPDHEVVVLEKGQVAGEATALSAGVVGLAAKYLDAPDLVRHTADFFADFDDTETFAFEQRPYVAPVRPDDDPDGAVTEARERAAALRGMGAPAEYVDAKELEERFPRIDASEFAGAVVHGAYPGRGFLDPYAFATSLQAVAETAGTEFRTGVTVEGFEVEDSGVTAVTTDEGRVTADHVVVAAGWRTPDLLDGLTEIPVRPYRTQCVVLEPDPPCDESFPMGNVPGEHVYFRPELNGNFLIGGHSHVVDDPTGASKQADAEFVDHVAALLPRVFHDMDRAGLVDGWAGVDAATPDTRPIVDAPDDAPAGLVVATGFNGLGVMTAPAAAAAIRALVTGEDAPFDADVFTVDRFESRSRDFEFSSVSDH